MKRTILEWTAICLAAFSCVGAVYWGVSFATDAADFRLAFRRASPSVHMETHAGNVRFCDQFDSAEAMEDIDRGLPFTPKPTRNIRWRIPGLEFHHIRFAERTPVWSLEISLLILVLLSALLSLVCFRAYRRVARHATNQAAAS